MILYRDSETWYTCDQVGGYPIPIPRRERPVTPEEFPDRLVVWWGLCTPHWTEVKRELESLGYRSVDVHNAMDCRWSTSIYQR